MRSRLASAPKGTLVLAGSGATAGKIPVLLSKQPEAKEFMAFRFRGFGLCAELHGEEMDGILASATLEDLGVYEVGGGVKETALGAMTQRSMCRCVNPQNGASMFKLVIVRINCTVNFKPRPVL